MNKIYYLLLLVLLPLMGAAQGGTQVIYTSGTYSIGPRVSFTVSWPAGSRVTYGNKVYSSKVWIFIDYKDLTAGTWNRALIKSVDVPAAGTTYTAGDRGFWLQGATNGAYSQNITVTLQSVPSKFSWCVFVSDRPPVVNVNINNADFSGTPPFVVTYSDATSGTFANKISNPVIKRIVSLTDKTNCPSTDIQCAIATPTLSGGGSFCNTANVNFTTTTTVGCTYSLLLNGVATGKTLTGNGSSQSFSAVSVAGNYTVLATNIAAACTAVSNIKTVQIVLPVSTADLPVNACGCSAAASLTLIGSYCRNLIADNAAYLDCDAIQLEVKLQNAGYSCSTVEGTLCDVENGWRWPNRGEAKCMWNNRSAINFAANGATDRWARVAKSDGYDQYCIGSVYYMMVRESYSGECNYTGGTVVACQTCTQSLNPVRCVR